MGFEFQALLTDLDWVLAHFTLAADLTTLRDECRFVHAEKEIVVRYQGLPFPELAFLGQDPGQLSGLAAQLVGPDEPFYLLLNEGQAQVAERVFAVEQAHPVWQMLFARDPAGLDAGGAVSLGRGGDDGGGRYFASPFRDACHFTTARERGIIIVVC